MALEFSLKLVECSSKSFVGSILFLHSVNKLPLIANNGRQLLYNVAGWSFTNELSGAVLSHNHCTANSENRQQDSRNRPHLKRKLTDQELASYSTSVNLFCWCTSVLIPVGLVASPATGHWGTCLLDFQQFHFSSLWSKSESHLYKYCVVCDISSVQISITHSSFDQYCISQKNY